MCYLRRQLVFLDVSGMHIHVVFATVLIIVVSAQENIPCDEYWSTVENKSVQDV